MLDSCVTEISRLSAHRKVRESHDRTVARVRASLVTRPNTDRPTKGRRLPR